MPRARDGFICIPNLSLSGQLLLLWIPAADWTWTHFVHVSRGHPPIATIPQKEDNFCSCEPWSTNPLESEETVASSLSITQSGYQHEQFREHFSEHAMRLHASYAFRVKIHGIFHGSGFADSRLVSTAAAHVNHPRKRGKARQSAPFQTKVPWKPVPKAR